MAVRTRAEGDWLEFVADLLAQPLTQLPEERVALQFVASFDLAGCSFNDEAPGPGVLRLWPRESDFAGRRRQLEAWLTERGPLNHPLVRHYLASTQPVPAQIADIPAGVTDRGLLDEWHDFARSGGFGHQLLLPLDPRQPCRRALVLARPISFTGAEMALARQLWRLLGGLDRQIAALAGSRVHPGVASAVRLTPRELAVLALVADGLTAAAVGRRLGIAERTVHKHLERTYAKLEVRDRVSAVLRAHRLGLLTSAAS